MVGLMAIWQLSWLGGSMLAGWLIGMLAVCRFAGWLAGMLVGWYVGQLYGRCTGCMVCASCTVGVTAVWKVCWLYGSYDGQMVGVRSREQVWWIIWGQEVGVLYTVYVQGRCVAHGEPDHLSRGRNCGRGRQQYPRLLQRHGGGTQRVVRHLRPQEHQHGQLFTNLSFSSLLTEGSLELQIISNFYIKILKASPHFLHIFSYGTFNLWILLT